MPDSEGEFLRRLLRSIAAVDDFFQAQVLLLTERMTALRQACEDPSTVMTAMLARVSDEIDLVCQGVEWLRHYANLNALAIRKILKKHDKLSPIPLTNALHTHVEKKSFSSLSNVDALLRIAESLLSHVVAGRSPPPAAASVGAGRSVAPPPSLSRQPAPEAEAASGMSAAEDSGTAGTASPPSCSRDEPEAPTALFVPNLTGEDPSQPKPVRRGLACVECYRAKAACQGFPCTRCVRLGKVCVPREKHKRQRTVRSTPSTSAATPSAECTHSQQLTPAQHAPPQTVPMAPAPAAIHAHVPASAPSGADTPSQCLKRPAATAEPPQYLDLLSAVARMETMRTDTDADAMTP
tara:strand:- start:145 stop:1197 length:1053 start_codon:yes stop_codon:yes gene_type:complete